MVIDIIEINGSEDLFETIFEENVEPIVLVTEENVVIRANKEFEKVFGYDQKKIEGENINDFIVPEKLGDEGKELIQKSKKGLNNFETYRKAKNGELIPVLVSAKKISSKKQRLFVATYKVIKEKKEKEEKLKKYKLAIEGSSDLIAALDQEFNYIFANKAYRERYGVDEIENKSLEEVIPDDEYKEVRNKAQRCLSGEKTQYEMERNSKERGRGIVAVLRDITGKKRLKRREKILHSLLIHDVSNKLQIVKGYLNLLGETELSENQLNKLNKTRRGLKDTENLINRVKVLEEVEKTDPEKYLIKNDIKAVINELSDFSKRKNIELVNEIGKEKTEVLGGALLKDLFRNLLRNSIEHSEAKKIWIRKEELPNYFIFKVEDNGIGISDEEKQKIIQKGYSTKGGDGLGLFIVKEIVDAYHGHIRVKDSEQNGASFQVFLRKPK